MSRLLRLLLAAASALVIVLAMTGTTHAQAPGVPKWTKIADFPIPQEELYGAVVNNKFYVLGGFDQAYMGMVFEYDPATDKWTRKKDMPVKVHHQAQAAYNGKLYVFGGCLRAISGEGGVTNTWEWDPVTDVWKALAPMPVKRCSAVADEVGGKIYVIGGLEPFENGPGARRRGRNQTYAPAATTRDPRR